MFKSCDQKQATWEKEGDANVQTQSEFMGIQATNSK